MRRIITESMSTLSGEPHKIIVYEEGKVTKGEECVTKEEAMAAYAKLLDSWPWTPEVIEISVKKRTKILGIG